MSLPASGINQTLDSISKTTLLNFPNGASLTVGHVVSTLVLLIIGYIIALAIRYLLGRKLATSRLRPDAINTIHRVSTYIVFIVIGLTILSLLGIPTSTFAFATGAIAIGVGFGAQNIINNFISGWILLAERPIRVNDFIEIEGVYGTVQQIGTRSTRIHRTDGVHLMVPNSKLLESTVTNWTLKNDLIRTSLKVGVVYGSDIKLIHNILVEILEQHPMIESDPGTEVNLDDFGADAIIFEVYFWASVSRERSLRQIRSDLRYAIAERFEENSVVIAFPQRDIHIKNSEPIKVAVDSAKQVGGNKE